MITRGKELGYYFTVPPSIVKGSNFQTLAKKVGIKQLLTETDAPWQAPVKETINEPANVKIAIKKVAEVLSLSEEEVEKQIWQNYVKIFG